MSEEKRTSGKVARVSEIAEIECDLDRVGTAPSPLGSHAIVYTYTYAWEGLRHSSLLCEHQSLQIADDLHRVGAAPSPRAV